MKTIFTILLIAVIAAGCSSVKVSYDYDKAADFTKYKSYKIADEVKQSGINQLDLDRIIRAVESEMAKRGITKSDNPDAVIDFQVKLQQQQTATATNYGGYGGYRYGYSPGFSQTNIDINTYIEGTLFINLIDKEQQKIVWQGRGTKTIDEHASAEKKEANINKAISYIFQKYPVPPTKK